MSEWISISEKLPEDLQKCLFYPINGKKQWNRRIISGFYEKENRTFFDIVEYVDFDIKQISHWMPTPEPPEET